MYTTHSYLLFCNSTHLSIQASFTENLHKPVTAALYHLIGPWWERHLNMQIIQKLWINFTHKCLKSLALLLKEFSISSTEAKKSQKFSMWGERDTVYANDSGVCIDSPATVDKSEIKQPMQSRRRVLDVVSIMTFPNRCHVVIFCHQVCSIWQSDCRELPYVFSEKKKSRQWQVFFGLRQRDALHKKRKGSIEI